MEKLDIFNKALGMIGHDRAIADGDTTSAEYLRCEREWDGARLSVLTASDDGWNWLVMETPLIQGAETSDAESNLYEWSYDRPDDAIRLLGVLDGFNRRVDYRIANGVIYTDKDEVKFRYMADNEDPDDWPPPLQEAITSELASRIALPMTSNPKMVQAMKQLALAALAEALKQDAKEMRRGGTAGTRYADSRN